MTRSSPSARQAVEAAGDVAQRFAGDIENARQNRAGIERRNGPGTRFSIQDVQGQNNDYPDCVVLDTNLFTGVKPRDWGRVLQNYIYNNFAGKTLTLYDESWYSETVEIARYNDRVTKDGGARNHRAIDDLAWTRGNNIQALATAHIGEILEVSTYEAGNDINNHGWMDKNGWTFRHAYLCDIKGNIYEATLNISEGENRRILYRVTNIKEIDKRTAGAKGLSAGTGRSQATTNGPSISRIPNNGPKVKHFSDEQQIKRINADYLKAVDIGDMRTTQRMVDEVAKRAGYDMELYHGSKKGGGFTVFKDWQYFTPNKAYAERYMERDNPDSMYHVYVKSERMFDTRRPECREIFEQMRAEYGLSELQENGLPDWTDGYDISDFIEENGLDFDGVVLDEGGDLTEDGPVSRGVSYIIRNSEQVKSAEPVTYDDTETLLTFRSASGRIGAARRPGRTGIFGSLPPRSMTRSTGPGRRRRRAD